MPQIIGQSTPVQANPAGANIASGLNGIAGAFLDVGSGAVKAEAIEKSQAARRTAEATAAAGERVSDAYRRYGAGQPVDMGALAADAVAAGTTPEAVNAWIRNIGAARGGVNDPGLVNAQIANGQYNLTPAGTAGERSFQIQKQRDAADRTPVQAMLPGGTPGWVTQGDIVNGRANGAQPMVGPDIFKAAAGANAGIYTGITGTNPNNSVEDDGGYGGSSSSGAPLTSDQRITLGLDSNKPETIQNYAVAVPGGRPVVGRTADGKTDLTSGQPLPGNAQLVSPGNQAGAAGALAPFQPDNAEMKSIRQTYQGAGDLAKAATQVAQLARSNPSTVGFTGDIARTAQGLIGQGQTLAKSLGFGDLSQAAQAQAARIAGTVDLNNPDIVKNMDPQFVKNLTDPGVNDVVRMHAIVTSLAAPILFPGNSQYMYSKHGISQVQSIIGDPNRWIQDPNAYAAGMERIAGIAQQAQQRAAAQLQEGNVAAGPSMDYNPSGATPAAPPAAAMGDEAWPVGWAREMGNPHSGRVSPLNGNTLSAPVDAQPRRTSSGVSWSVAPAPGGPPQVRRYVPGQGLAP